MDKMDSADFYDSVETVEMDQETAKHLFEEGGIFVALDVPPETDFGIDIKSWTTGDQFKGIKMIPPGFHFIHYSAVNKHGDTAPRVGFFHFFNKSELLVKRWSIEEEGISNESAPEELKQVLKSNLKNVDKYLGVYPYDMYKNWVSLTNQITPVIVERCSPLCGLVKSALDLVNVDDPTKQKDKVSLKRKRSTGNTIEEKEEQLLPNLKPIAGTELRLTPILDKLYPDDATPSQITQHNLDSSYALEVLISKMNDPLEIIGEMQIAFICFLAGQSLDAFEHWKKLVTMLCRVDKGIPVRRALFSEFITALEKQLDYVPEEMLCDIVASNNFVYQNLRRLFANIDINTEIDGRLKTMVTRFREQLTTKYMWDFENLQAEKDDEAPVVVDTN